MIVPKEMLARKTKGQVVNNYYFAVCVYGCMNKISSLVLFNLIIFPRIPRSTNDNTCTCDLKHQKTYWSHLSCWLSPLGQRQMIGRDIGHITITWLIVCFCQTHIFVHSIRSCLSLFELRNCSFSLCFCHAVRWDIAKPCLEFSLIWLLMRPFNYNKF